MHAGRETKLSLCHKPETVYREVFQSWSGGISQYCLATQRPVWLQYWRRERYTGMELGKEPALEDPRACGCHVKVLGSKWRD